MTEEPAKVYASDIECRCDCVNCVTGHHDGCYYEPHCYLKYEEADDGRSGGIKGESSNKEGRH